MTDTVREIAVVGQDSKRVLLHVAWPESKGRRGPAVAAALGGLCFAEDVEVYVDDEDRSPTFARKPPKDDKPPEYTRKALTIPAWCTPAGTPIPRGGP